MIAVRQKSKRGRAASGLRIEVRTVPSARQFVPFLRRHLRQAHHIVRPPLVELSIALVGESQIRKLHTEFLSLTDATDVLTFELDHDARGRVIGGEVVVCVPVARRQAKALGNSHAQELLLYALHGMLHLCGFDDRTPAGFAAMHAREDQILTRLGVGKVFRPSAVARGRRQRGGGR